MELVSGETSLADGCLLAPSSHVLFDRGRESSVVSAFEDTSPVGLGPTLMTSFNLNDLALPTKAAT